ncbi:unnamed protein product [Timema podura]|uniref:Uncharacterized protein n=1 Tax=Timema podura TaxID=61482 RepID=A0ABN7NKM9_TIMPD|nr:unnamed protein product [Timema podura]
MHSLKCSHEKYITDSNEDIQCILPNQSNPLVIGSLIYCESDTLNHSTTENVLWNLCINVLEYHITKCNVVETYVGSDELDHVPAAWNKLTVKSATFEENLLESLDLESDFDGDSCDIKTLKTMFSGQYELEAETSVSMSRCFVLHISGSVSSNSKIVAALSNYSCAVYDVPRLTKLDTTSEHKGPVSGIK